MTALPELPQRKGVDLSLPAQEAFRDWPPRHLLERPYWLPWSWGSFERAALFGRPVLFVMAVRWNRPSQRMMNETLFDPQVLGAVNDAYIAVQVDPDRRPDVRERYQTGTWPVVAFLLPNAHPMLSQANDLGVAKPITTGRIDVEPMLFLLREGDIYYRKWAGLLTDVGQTWVDREGPPDPVAGEVEQAASDGFARWLLATADKQSGGFGLAPKFVLPGLFEYAMLRQARLLPALQLHARLTLEKLVSSPLYDGREGGLHRMAASPGWSDIQYEKMLEANSYLLRDLVFALRGRDSTELRRAVEQTAGFITEVLARPRGGFFLAQWADPKSQDGGGYWRGDSADAPPVERLVLAGPNAVAGAALLRAGIWLGEEDLERAGLRGLQLVLDRAYRPGRGVDHVIEPGPRNHRFLWAQADVALGFVDAYQTTGDTRFLNAARDVVDFALNNLLAEDSPLLIDHLAQPVQVGLLANVRHPMRPNVRLARAMLRLWHLGQGESYREHALAILGALAGDLTGYRTHGTEAALAVEEAVQEPLKIQIQGDPGAAATQALRRAAINTVWTWTLVSWLKTGEAASATITWRGKSEQVSGPEQLTERIRRMTGGPGAGSQR